MLSAHVFALRLLAKETSFAKGTCVLRLSTHMIILGFCPMHFHITNLANVPLYDMCTIYGVIFNNVRDKALSAFKVLSTGVALILDCPMCCVYVMDQRYLVVCYLWALRALVLILFQYIFIMFMYDLVGYIIGLASFLHVMSKLFVCSELLITNKT